MSQASNKSFDRDRQAAVDNARQEWMNRLIDSSRCNKLLYLNKQLSKLDFSEADQTLLNALLAGRSVAIADLLPNLQKEVVLKQIHNIYEYASKRENKNFKTLFLALGIASWFSKDGKAHPKSPVLIIPMTLTIKEVAHIQRKGDGRINPVLLYGLKDQYGCSITPKVLLGGVENIAEGQAPNVSTIYAHLERAATEVPGFRVEPKAILSNFCFSKMAMEQDLNNSLEQMVAHDVIAAMAGDEEARQSIRSFHGGTDARELDRIPPEQEFLVFDADSSQQLVIQAVLAGHNALIQGPPGTGKSQTIANLIASLSARGQRILFVTEKETALEVVKQKFEQKNLEHLVLDLHDPKTSKRTVIQQFKESFEILRTATSVNSDDIHFKLQECRIKLNQYGEKLHKERLPFNLSFDEVQGELLKFSICEQTSARFREISQISNEKADAVEQLLIKMTDSTSANLFLGTHPSPWYDTQLVCSGLSISQVLNRVGTVAGILKFLQASLQRLVGTTTLSSPETLEEVRKLIYLVQGVNHTLSIYSIDVFHQDLEKQIKALGPANPNGTFIEVMNFIVKKFAPNSDLNCAILEIQALRSEGEASAQEMFKELKEIDSQLKRWRSLSSADAIPCETSRREIFILKALFDYLRSNLDKVEPYLRPYSQRYFGGQRLFRVPLEQLSKLFNSLVEDQETPRAIILTREIEQKIEELGAKSILVEFQQSKPNPYLWTRQFRYAWLASQLEHAQFQDPELAAFKRESHEKLIAEFRQLDQEHLDTTVARVRHAHAQHVIAIRNAYPEQDSLVQEEVQKKIKHLPLHQLFAQATDVLTALRPCWMASPLSVSELLDSQHSYFDVVIFDEASQILSEDAIPAILRAKRVVVVGDRHQLPPTNFFAKAKKDSKDKVSSATSSESLLDLMSTFLEPWLLSWHYRSRDEALIAFSNRHIYGDRLITFPNPRDQVSISHVLIPFIPNQNGHEKGSNPEVKRVVELVIEHAVKRPDQSLGVITMGSKHATAVEHALEAALKGRLELNPFFDQDRCECFFAKSIEKVQGDERDAIILSVGYRKNDSGNLPHRFGPLLQEGGERRLNVAITRARQCMTLVSSFDHSDIDLTRSKARGVELLRSYIEYASNRGKFEEDCRKPVEQSLSSLELDVFKALKERGISLLPQWGSSQHRISMVAQHPNNPERFVLAIECDGPSYYAVHTVRDRDRLRPQQLEALGWRIHRIWSMDWFRHRDAEIERAVAAYKAAVELANQIDALSRQYEVDTSKSKQPQSIGSQLPIRVVRQRQPRPKVPQYEKIDSYSQEELISLVHWIKSDGYLRTDTEILYEMLPELGFKRCGTKIEATVRAAIKQVAHENVKTLHFLMEPCLIDPQRNEV